MAHEPYSRPKKPRWDFNPQQIIQLEGFGAVRVPYERIAAIFGVSKSTFERALKKNAAARASLEKGMAIASANIRQTAFQQASSGNTTMLIFWLKTQEGFREKDREGEDDKKKTKKKADPEELRRLRRHLEETDPVPEDSSSDVEPSDTE